MNEEELKKYIGKRFKIFLKNRIVYHCVLLSISNNSLTVRDKFGSLVFVNLEDVSSLVLISGSVVGSQL